MRRCAAYIRLYAPRDDQTNSAVPPTHPAVTVALCQGVVHPFSSGMGGGTFILISMANGTSEVVDAREQAPAAATERMYVGKPEASLTGGTAIAVPGALQGLRLYTTSRHPLQVNRWPGGPDPGDENRNGHFWSQIG